MSQHRDKGPKRRGRVRSQPDRPANENKRPAKGQAHDAKPRPDARPAHEKKRPAKGPGSEAKRQSKPPKAHQRTEPPKGKPAKGAVPAKDTWPMRLNKFLAHAGVAARRKSDELIFGGQVRVNGQLVKEPGHRVRPKDRVTLNGKELKAEKPVYLLLNKPKGFIATAEDEKGRRTVLDLVASTVGERLFPVGRLDRNTTGLLLLTNDGTLADRLMHPSFQVKKIYDVTLDNPLKPHQLQLLQEGITLEEGVVPIDHFSVLNEERTRVGVELHVGWNRVIRRMFEALGLEVVRLDRVVFANLTKKDLPRGKYRPLTEAELNSLKHLNVS